MSRAFALARLILMVTVWLLAIVPMALWCAGAAIYAVLAGKAGANGSPSRAGPPAADG